MTKDKIAPDDEGKITFAIYEANGHIIIDFGHAVKWIGLSPNDAINLANVLIKQARKINKKGLTQYGSNTKPILGH